MKKLFISIFVVFLIFVAGYLVFFFRGHIITTATDITNSTAGFEYRLVEVLSSLEDTVPELSVVVDNHSVLTFQAIFDGGGGLYDLARLAKEGSLYTVFVFDSDSIAEKRLVRYQLDGKIAGVKDQTFTVKIVDGNGSNKVLLEKEFSIVKALEH